MFGLAAATAATRASWSPGSASVVRSSPSVSKYSSVPTITTAASAPAAARTARSIGSPARDEAGADSEAAEDVSAAPTDSRARSSYARRASSSIVVRRSGAAHGRRRCRPPAPVGTSITTSPSIRSVDRADGQDADLPAAACVGNEPAAGPPTEVEAVEWSPSSPTGGCCQSHLSCGPVSVTEWPDGVVQLDTEPAICRRAPAASCR